METSRLVYGIPLVVLLYISYTYFFPVAQDGSSAESGSALYIIDVGSQDTAGDAVLQGPFDRISEPLRRGDVTYRLIQKDLVYFGSKLKQNFSRVKVELRFVDAIPEGDELNIGIKNKKEWSYAWKTVYNPFYGSLEEKYSLAGEDNDFRIFSQSDSLTVQPSSFLGSPPEGSVIAADVPVELNKRLDVYYRKSSSAGELRGDHTFYIYTGGDLNLTVKKQDLNWYSGPDNLEIKLYSSANRLIKNTTIPDDGNTGNDSSRGTIQTGSLGAALEEGIYKVVMATGGGDMLIRNIELNSGSIVIQNPFLAGVLYTNATRFNLYTRAVKGDRLGFQTYHADGLQTVNITRDNYTKSLNITDIQKWHYIDLPPSDGLYRVEIPKGDIVIDADSYFSFSRDSYFNPFPARVLSLQNSMDWLEKNKVDYVVIPNQHVIRDGNWTVASTEFNLSDAYIENNALNFAISAPHLKDYNYSIPVDWIKIYMKR